MTKNPGLQKSRAEQEGEKGPLEDKAIGDTRIPRQAVPSWSYIAQVCYQNHLATTELRFNQLRVSHSLP